MNIQHSSATNEWYTPASVMGLVREVLGPLDLDPASCARANQTVQATTYLDQTYDALANKWPAARTVFLNPPGGRKGKRSNAILFWERLLQYRVEEPTFEHAIFVAFSIEFLQTSQSSSMPAMALPLCVPRQRIRFDSPSMTEQSPSHSNALIYVQGRTNASERFAEVFRNLGYVLVPSRFI